MSLVHVADNLFCLCQSLRWSERNAAESERERQSERETLGDSDFSVQVVLLRSADASGSLMFRPEVYKRKNKERLCLRSEE